MISLCRDVVPLGSRQSITPLVRARWLLLRTRLTFRALAYCKHFSHALLQKLSCLRQCANHTYWCPRNRAHPPKAVTSKNFSQQYFGYTVGRNLGFDTGLHEGLWRRRCRFVSLRRLSISPNFTKPVPVFQIRPGAVTQLNVPHSPANTRSRPSAEAKCDGASTPFCSGAIIVVRCPIIGRMASAASDACQALTPTITTSASLIWRDHLSPVPAGMIPFSCWLIDLPVVAAEWRSDVPHEQ